MKRYQLILVLLLGAVSWACGVSAQEQEPGKDAGAPLNLGELEVTGEGWTLEQETSLRLIRSAYGNSRSMRQEDRDEWVCWLEKATGSWFNYLHCARNGDLWVQRRDNGLDTPTIPSAGYGRILITEQPVNRDKLERALDSLAGSAEFDQEFLLKVANGETPLGDPPNDEEVARFARAYEEVNRLVSSGATEEAQIRAIEAEGLSLDRYNHIADLSRTYDSVRREIAARLDG